MAPQSGMLSMMGSLLQNHPKGREHPPQKSCLEFLCSGMPELIRALCHFKKQLKDSFR